jgi:ribosomal protein S18 acetylase RimI-like enzyme
MSHSLLRRQLYPTEQPGASGIDKVASDGPPQSRSGPRRGNGMRTNVKVRERKATIGDLTAIRHLRQASLRVLAAEAYDRAAIESLTQDTSIDDAGMVRDGALFVLELDGEVVACGGWAVDMPQSVAGDRAALDQRGPHSAWVQSLHVDPGFAREGFGSRLMSLLEREIAARGFGGVQIAATLNAMPFCTAMGYRPLGLIRELVPGSAHVAGAIMAKPVAARLAVAA